MNLPISWTSRVEDYLSYRRRFGFALKNEDSRLKQFAQFAEQMSQQDHLTVELAIQWARTSKRQSPITWGYRIEVLRGFAKYWQQFDPYTEIPPPGLFGSIHRRLVPHIYTHAEILALMEATVHLMPLNGLRPTTCRTVFGLLASCGLRISEALNLTRKEVDLDSGLLTIREAKFHKSRLVPLHPSVTTELQAYAQLRDRLVPFKSSEQFFLFDNGKSVNPRGIRHALLSLCKQLGWQPRGDHQYHRLHDLRHTFIVHNAVRFYQQNINIDSAVLALSTYVGHAKVADTYWYFTGIPELMSLAAERFEHHAQGESE